MPTYRRPLDRAVNMLDADGKKAKQGADLYEDTLTQLSDLLGQAFGTDALGVGTP